MTDEYMKGKCNAVFGNAGEDYSLVFRSIQESKMQTHGTTLVVLLEEHAQSGGRRLSKLNLGMEDAYPNVQVGVINRLNSIDGYPNIGKMRAAGNLKKWYDLWNQ